MNYSLTFPFCFGFTKIYNLLIDTTRAPRQGEVDGEHYHYVDKVQFAKLIKEEAFIEHAEFGGNLYGTSKASIKNVFEKGLICVLDIESHGVESIRALKTSLDCYYCFNKPPSLEVLEKRLRGRKSDGEEAITKRMAEASKEMKWYDTKASQWFDKTVVNDDFDRAYNEFKGWISLTYNLP